MSWYLLAVAIFVIIILAATQLDRLRRYDSDKYSYTKKESLFSPAERSFLGVLNQAVGKNAQIFGKVRVADVVAPEKGLSRSLWQTAFNKISGKHFDFLLCNEADLSVICAVELDDKSHHSKNRKQRDAFLAGVCDSAGIPLIQVPVKRAYVVNELKQLFAPLFNMSLASIPKEPDQVAASSNDKICAKCSSPMMKRIIKKGKNAGNEFWGCTGFPKCRHTEALVIESEPLPLEEMKEEMS